VRGVLVVVAGMLAAAVIAVAGVGGGAEAVGAGGFILVVATVVLLVTQLVDGDAHLAVLVAIEFCLRVTVTGGWGCKNTKYNHVTGVALSVKIQLTLTLVPAYPHEVLL
jgi:hypothetical protein